MKYLPTIAYLNSGKAGMPLQGSINNLVIFIRFQGETEFITTIAEYDKIFNSNVAGDDSVYNFFNQTYYNQVNVRSTFFSSRGNTVVSYEDANPRAYYMPYDATTNPIGYTSATRWIRETTLLKNALLSIKAEIEAIDLNLDVNHDGEVDSITFIVSGPTESNYRETLLAPHCASLENENIQLKGKEVEEYVFMLDDMLWSGLIVHEMADICVTQVASKVALYPDQEVIYTITVSNLGPSVAQSVVLDDYIPAGFKNVAYTVDNGTWKAWTTPCALGDLTAGQAKIIVIKGIATCAVTGKTINIATAYSTIPDPNPSNNTAQVAVSILKGRGNCKEYECCRCEKNCKCKKYHKCMKDKPYRYESHHKYSEEKSSKYNSHDDWSEEMPSKYESHDDWSEEMPSKQESHYDWSKETSYRYENEHEYS